ncbi:MAG: hypothetical protein JW751_24245 [Polyangiaceae bacterium]|nr:hypothetical protein [Polyangiaceae bacterium]
MRLATVVASDYRSTPGLPGLPAAPGQAALVRKRLLQPDAAFAVEQLGGHRDLPETLEQRLGSLPRRAANAIFYFNGYVVWQPGRTPALALDAVRPRAYPIPRLCALLDRFCDEYLLVLDAALPGDGERRGSVADALCQVIGEYGPRASGVLSITSGPPGGGSGAFTERLLAELDAAGRSAPSPTPARALFARLQHSLAGLARSHALRMVPSAPEFPILAGAMAGSAAERARAAARDSVAPPPPSADPRLVAYHETLTERAVAFAQAQDWAALAQVYEAMLDAPPYPKSSEVAQWLAAYYRTVHRDPLRAAHALERAAAAAPGEAPLRFELGDAWAEAGQAGHAIDHLRAGVTAEPRDPGGYRRLATLFARANMTDSAWNATASLAFLEAADDDQQAFVAAHRPDGLLAATTTLREEHWQHSLGPPVRYPALEEVLRTVRAAAIEHTVTTRQRRALAPDPAMRQDAKTSTTTLCRSLTWTARLLGMQAPELYVEASDQAFMRALPFKQPTTVVSKAFASGLSLPELVFLWGRHLTYYYQDYVVFVFYPTLDAMIRLLMAALWASDWDPKRLRSEDAETSRLAAHLHKTLDESALSSLRAATRNLTPARGRRRVRSYTEAIDRVANRAGLLACGDVAVAGRMIERFPVETAVADPVGDLLQFSVSAEYAELRAQLGVAI